ncbi:MAG: hypothetical protein SVR81_02760 [Chloroflexota bacterium]|nr:hypothetical protein [Chloroflexota bacterium]
MPYSILVFNQDPISEIIPENVIAAVTESNYQTLCCQYGLDPALIESAKAHLRLIGPHDGDDPFFALAYGPATQRPVLVYLLDLDQALRAELAPVLATVPQTIEAALRAAAQVVRVELGRAQLTDMGLLLAYELARWAAVKGSGLIHGLDGQCYRLNRHRAFLPVED